MIRFILKRKTQDTYNGMQGESYETILLDVPELEALLIRGGCGEQGYDQTDLLGAEIVVALADTAIASHIKAGQAGKEE